MAPTDTKSKKDHAASSAVRSTRLRPAPPRYRVIAAELIADIAAERFPLGSTLPGEHVLRERFGVSRFTVREALRELSDLGFVEKRRGVGTIVLSRFKDEPYVNTVKAIGELLQYPPDTEFDQRGDRHLTLNRAQADLLRQPVGAEFSLLSGLRLVPGDPPICWADFYMKPEIESSLRALLKGRSVRPMVIERTLTQPIERVCVDLSATAVRGAVARALGVPAGSPALRIVRTYFGPQEQVLLVTVNIFPEGRFTYSMDIRKRT